MSEQFNLNEALRQTPEYREAVKEQLNGSGHDDEAENSRMAQEERELPEIRITTEISAVVDETERALMELPRPIVYQRAGKLCQIAYGRKTPVWLQRPPDAPSIVLADPVSLREYARQAATFVKFDKRAKEWQPALPPEWVLNTLSKRV